MILQMPRCFTAADTHVYSCMQANSGIPSSLADPLGGSPSSLNLTTWHLVVQDVLQAVADGESLELLGDGGGASRQAVDSPQAVAKLSPGSSKGEPMGSVEEDAVSVLEVGLFTSNFPVVFLLRAAPISGQLWPAEI